MGLRVFMSYAREDRGLVEPYYSKLKGAGYLPWMDVLDVLPGQNWEFEIENALNLSHVVLIFASTRSVTKRGFVQREALQALENARHKLEDDIYILVARLDKCDIPKRLKKTQWSNLFEKDGWTLILRSLALAAKRYKVAFAEGKELGGFRVITRTVEEQWEGSPGYAVELEYPEIISDVHQEACAELNLVFKNMCLGTLHEMRNAKFFQHEPNRAFLGGYKDGRWRKYHITHLNERAVSVLHTISWFGTGMPHPNYSFLTTNYSLNPVTILSLPQFFRYGSEYEKSLSSICRDSLKKQMRQRLDGELEELDTEWLERGTQPNQENFNNFTFDRMGFSFYFAPYHVSAYALGSWDVVVPYEEVTEILRRDEQIALLLGR